MGNSYTIEWITPGDSYLGWNKAGYDSYQTGEAFGCFGEPYGESDDFLFTTYGCMLPATKTRPALINTPVGEKVTVRLPFSGEQGEKSAFSLNMILVFDKVISQGTTAIALCSKPAPLPKEYHCGHPECYFNITTDAEWVGLVRLCVDYSSISFQNNEALRLLHFERGVWVDATSQNNFSRNILCGKVGTLSPFTIVEKLRSKIGIW